MKRRAVYLLFALAFSPGALPADDAPMWVYRYVLATATDPTQLIPITMGVRARKELRTPEFLDLVAEVALTIEAVTKEQRFARKELVEQLGRLGGPRYQTTLRKIADEWVPSAAREKARMFVRGDSPPKDAQYLPGTIKLAEMRAQYAAAAIAAPPPTDEHAQRLMTVETEVTIEELLAAAGLPQAVSSRFPRGDPFSVRGYEHLGFYYRGVGRATFEYVVGRGWIVDNVIADPLAFEDFMPYRVDPAKYGQPDDATLALIQLLSESLPAMRLVLDNVEEADDATPEFLDTVAQLLLDHRADAMDAHTADVYAWMCVLLRRDGGPRYRPVLAAVAADAKSDHLRKHASAAIDGRKNPGAAPYADGTISIAAQRARYGSIYPARTFRAGYF